MRATTLTKPTVRGRGWSWLWLALLLGFLVLVPLVVLQARFLSDVSSTWRRLTALPRIGQTVVNTFILATGSVVIAVVLGAVLAVFAMQLPPRWRNVLGLAPVIPLVVPAVASVTGWAFLLSPRVGYINSALRRLGLASGLTGPMDVFSMTGIVIITGFYLTSFVYLYVFSSLKQRGNELEIAASAAGASPLQVFRTITLPLLRPALVYSGGITFLLGLGQFTVPLFLGAPRQIDVLTTQMYQLSQKYPIDYALGSALSVPLVLAGVLVVVLQKRMLGDGRRFVAVTGKGRHVPSRTTRWAAVPLLTYVAVAVLLPLASLVVIAVSPFWSGKIQPSHFTLAAFHRVLGDQRVQSAVTTTIEAVGISLAIVLPLGFLAAYAVTSAGRIPRLIAHSVDIMSNLALSMPAALFGFALLSIYAGPPFDLYGTTAVIVIAYVTLMIPHAMRPQLTAMASLGREYVEAAHVSSAGLFRSLVTITVPMVRSSIGVAAALVFVMLSHEFSASVMVRSAKTQVLGTLLYDQWTSGTYPDVAVVALLMVGVTLVGVLIALTVGGFRSLEDM